MKEKSTLEQLFKTELNNQEFEYSEKLWQKLDTQLVPIRAEYQKKEKRRVLFLWWTAALLTLGGAGAYFASKNSGTANASATTNTASPTSKATSQQSNTVDQTTPTTITAPDLTNNKQLQNTNPSSADVVGNMRTIESNTGNYGSLNASTDNSSSIQSNHQKTRTLATRKKHINDIANETLSTEKEVEQDKTDKDVVIAIPDENKKELVQEANLTKDKNVAEKLTQPKEEIKPVAKVADKKKQKTSAKSSIYALAGINSSTPINKPGYYFGVQLEKQMDDKRRIFVGVKFAQNKLDHQLISSEKASIFPQVTDALIERMTTIQIPFGYQFKLSKKPVDKASLLSVGFEPTLLTGVKTIFYDDNGIVGGPRTPVVNSPLLKNAVNKFNLSFIVGLKMPITNKLGFTLSGGYGLIDITDKKYYNRTSTNNNLKYIQAGLLLRLK